MPKLPDVLSLGERPIPQSQRPIVGFEDNRGKALQQFGAQVQDTGKTMQDGQDQLDLAYAKGALLKNQIDTLDSFQNDQDYATFDKRYDDSMSKAKLDASNMISNPRAKALFDADANNTILQGTSKVRTMANERRKDYGLASDMAADDQDIKLALSNPDHAAAIIQNATARKDANVASGIYDPATGYKKKREFANNYGETWYDSLTPDKQAAVWAHPQGGGFDNAIGTVLKNEGGYNASDGHTGNPVNFGINQGSHPEVDVKNLTQDQAKAIYKKDYWDAKGMDAVPAGVQDVVFDGVVNHTSAFGKQLIDASKNGASRQQLIDMRRNEYDRLVTAAPEKYQRSEKAWNDRLDGLQQSSSQVLPKTGTPLDFVAPENVIKLRTAYVKQQAENQKNLVLDPQQYAQDAGLTPTTPLNYSDPSALGTQLAQRAQVSDQLQQKGSPGNLFTKGEAQQFGYTLAQKPALERMQYLASIRTASGDNMKTYANTMQQLRPDSPITAVSGLFMMNDVTPEEKGQPTTSQVALKLMKGEDLMNPYSAEKKENGTGKVFPMPSEKLLQQDFDGYVGDVFRGRPEAYSTAFQAYRAYYAASAAEAGKTNTDAPDRDISKEAQKAVIGDIANMGVSNSMWSSGAKVILPWGMSESTFRDVAHAKLIDMQSNKDNGISSIPLDGVAFENTDVPGKYALYNGTTPLWDKNHKQMFMQFGVTDGERLVDYQTLRDRMKISGNNKAASSYDAGQDNYRGYVPPKLLDGVIDGQAERMKAKGK